MLTLALQDQPLAEVDPTEARTGDAAPSYTIDTARRIAAPGRRFSLLLGTDQLFVFPQWHEAEPSPRWPHRPSWCVLPPGAPPRILAGGAGPSLAPRRRDAREHPGDRRLQHRHPRRHPPRREPNDLAPAVLAYIRDHGLYAD